MRALKCTVLFFTAVMLFGLGHDIARAMAAGAVGIPVTVHDVFLLLDRQPGTPTEALAVHLAPVIFSAFVALLGAWTYGQVREASPRTFWLYLTTLGSMTFLTAVTATAFSGGLHDIATDRGIPFVVQIAVSVTGGLLLVSVMWQAGVRLQPPLAALVIPLVAATVARLLVYAPMPELMAATMLTGMAPWTIAVVGSFWHWQHSVSAARSEVRPMTLPVSAVAFAVLLVVVVRMMKDGMLFGA